MDRSTIRFAGDESHDSSVTAQLLSGADRLFEGPPDEVSFDSATRTSASREICPSQNCVS